jgi:hypothetical protein
MAQPASRPRIRPGAARDITAAALDDPFPPQFLAAPLALSLLARGATSTIRSRVKIEKITLFPPARPAKAAAPRSSSK